MCKFSKKSSFFQATYNIETEKNKHSMEGHDDEGMLRVKQDNKKLQSWVTKKKKKTFWNKSWQPAFWKKDPKTTKNHSYTLWNTARPKARLMPTAVALVGKLIKKRPVISNTLIRPHDRLQQMHSKSL